MKVIMCCSSFFFIFKIPFKSSDIMIGVIIIYCWEIHISLSIDIFSIFFFNLYIMSKNFAIYSINVNKRYFLEFPFSICKHLRFHLGIFSDNFSISSSNWHKSERKNKRNKHYLWKLSSFCRFHYLCYVCYFIFFQNIRHLSGTIDIFLICI